MPGVCGQPINTDDVALLRADVFDEEPTRAGCVALIAHRGHKHYIAAVLRADELGWVIEEAAHTSSDRGVPRSAPAIFVGPGSRLSILGWAPTARATRMLLEAGAYRSSATPIDTGIVIAHFVAPVEALSAGACIRYLDEMGELQQQTFGSTGGFVSTELLEQREQ